MYIPQRIRDLEDYKRCIEFHGHTCMGVTIGYMAAKLALEMLEETRAEDEDIVAIVENDACCCDAIQVLTGCTFGKGNFFYRDYGKMVFTFASRKTGMAFRLLLKSDIFVVPEKEAQLAALIRSGESSKEMRTTYQQLFEERSEKLFQNGPAGFFYVEELVEFKLPSHAVKAASAPCERCGEMVMETKMELHEGQKLCRACNK